MALLGLKRKLLLLATSGLLDGRAWYAVASPAVGVSRMLERESLLQQIGGYEINRDAGVADKVRRLVARVDEDVENTERRRKLTVSPEQLFTGEERQLKDLSQLLSHLAASFQDEHDSLRRLSSFESLGDVSYVINEDAMVEDILG